MFFSQIVAELAATIIIAVRRPTAGLVHEAEMVPLERPTGISLNPLLAKETDP